MIGLSVTAGNVGPLESITADATKQLAALTAASKKSGEEIDPGLANWLKDIISLGGTAADTLSGIGPLDIATLEFNTAIDLGDMDLAIAKLAEMATHGASLQGTLNDLDTNTNFDNLLVAGENVRQLREEMEGVSPAIREMEINLLNAYILLNQFPTDINLKFVIKAEKALKEMKRVTAGVKAQKLAFKQLGQDMAATALASPFQALLADAENFEQQMVGIFKSMVSQLIAELAKLLVWQILTGLASGGLSQVGTYGGSFLDFTGIPKKTTGSGDGNSDRPRKGSSDLPALPPTKTSEDLLAFARAVTPQQAFAARRESADRFDPSTLLPLFPEPARQELHVHTPDVAGLVQAYRTGALGRAQAVAQPRLRRTL